MKRFLSLFALVLLAGCGPKPPDQSLILWEQPSPMIAAMAHAREKQFIAKPVAGVSMEPFLVSGDWVVYDPQAPWSGVKVGQVILYKPDWFDGPVIHQVAAKSGDGWIMSGINNAHYESSINGFPPVIERMYLGTFVLGYTTRKRP